jgi:hypothetical protein
MLNITLSQAQRGTQSYGSTNRHQNPAKKEKKDSERIHRLNKASTASDDRSHMAGSNGENGRDDDEAAWTTWTPMGGVARVGEARRARPVDVQPQRRRVGVERVQYLLRLGSFYSGFCRGGRHTIKGG